MNPLFEKILITGAPLLLRKLLRGNNIFKKLALVLLVLIASVWVLVQLPFNFTQQAPSVVSASKNKSSQVELSDVRSLYDAQRSNVMVSTVGNVTRILKDDTQGSRHQRFLIQNSEGLTLLVVHNIDLAPRVPLKVNDQVAIYGEYEWNNKGGVLHWTHHDPNKNHPDGWILHAGTKYK